MGLGLGLGLGLGVGVGVGVGVGFTCELNIWLNCTAGMRGAEATTSCSSRRIPGSVEPTPAWSSE